MTESDRTPVRIRDEQRVVLSALRNLLRTIGSANDAEDHGYTEDAARMRKDSCEAIQDLVMQHAFLAELFPKLQGELDTRSILVFGWAEICDDVSAYLQNSSNEPGNG